MEAQGKKNKDRHWLRYVRPLRLREFLYYKLCFSLHPNKFRHLYDKAPLEFVPGICLDLCSTDRGHQSIALMGLFELSLTRAIANLAKKGGLLVDVGANFGYYSCLWAGVNTKNRVIAFEPSPNNIPHLKLNVKNNNLESRVVITEAALADREGNCPFHLGPENQTGSGGLYARANENTALVSVRRLDEIFAQEYQGESIEVLKIDAEGADTLVLYGAERLLRKQKIRTIYFEENPARMKELGIKKDDAFKFLTSCGYKIKRLKGKIWQVAVNL